MRFELQQAFIPINRPPTYLPLSVMYKYQCMISIAVGDQAITYFDPKNLLLSSSDQFISLLLCTSLLWFTMSRMQLTSVDYLNGTVACLIPKPREKITILSLAIHTIVKAFIIRTMHCTRCLEKQELPGDSAPFTHPYSGFASHLAVSFTEYY